MAVRTKDELMTSLKDFLGDNTSDEAISLVQDISDTLAESNAETVEQLRQQITDQDNAWRKKYRDRFFSAPEKEDEEEPPKRPRTFDELFTKS